MYRLALGISIALHLSLIGYIWTRKPPSHYYPQEKVENKQPLQVRSLTDKELQAEVDARERLLNKGQIVQSDESSVNQKIPDTKLQEIFLSKHNQKVDRNTRAPRIGDFKNVLEEGTEDSVAQKEAAGAKAVAAKKAKNLEPIDAKNLFALASDYQNTDEGKVDAAGKLRAPSSIVGAGRKGDGLSASDDYLDGVAVGANTLLNTHEFKYYSFYERVRKLLVERWRARIRREIAKARLPTPAGNRLTLGSKVTKLQVRIGPTGEIAAVEKVGISGIDSFDQAAEISFREAAPFPHPPREMLTDDQLTIQWDFVVVVEEASLVQFNVNRAL